MKSGSVAFLKTTGEAVFVLDSSAYHSLPTGEIAVRYPSSPSHIVSYFFPDELETLDDQKARFLAEREELIKKYAPKPASIETTPNSNSGFGVN